MKKIMLLSLAALLTLGASAEEKKNGENNFNDGCSN